jgi:hypothetical protein
MLAANVKNISVREAGIWIAEQSCASTSNNSPNTSPTERAGFDAAKYAASTETITAQQLEMLASLMDSRKCEHVEMY